MPANRTRLAAVLRVSTSKQVDSGLGLDAQREAIAAFAKREGFSVVSEWSDEGVSGAACMDKRPGLSGAVGRPPFGFCVDAEGHLDLHPVNFTLLHTAVEMSESGVAQREIASILGCSQANVSQRLKRWKVGRRAKMDKLHQFVSEQLTQ